MSKMRLVFSSVRVDARPSAIAAILRSSHANNPRDGVTGALLSSRDRFLQLLEGDRTGVERCFARVQRDARHRDISVLVSMETSEILFPQEAMQSFDAADAGPSVAAALSPCATPAVVLAAFESLSAHPPARSAIGSEADGALAVLRRVHQAARHVLDDHLTRRHIEPRTLGRLGESLARQLAHAQELHHRLEAEASADPESRVEARHLCDLLEAAGHEVARRLGRPD